MTLGEIIKAYRAEHDMSMDAFADAEAIGIVQIYPQKNGGAFEQQARDLLAEHYDVPIIGGCVGFLFLDKNGMPRLALHWEKVMQRIRAKYTSEKLRPLPRITPHVCRHTFCTNMSRLGMNPKMLQYIMGHADVGVTLNTYTHVRYEDAEREMKRICSSKTA